MIKTKRFLPLLCAAGTLCSAEPLPEITAPVTRLAVFKNGVAAVERQMTAPAGDFLFTQPIAPIEGTLWFSPAAGLSVERVTRPVAEPDKFPFSNLAATFAGKKITVFYGEKQSVSGTVIAQPENDPEYIVLKKEDGKIFALDFNLIESFEAAEIPATVEKERPALLFHRSGSQKSTLSMRYLTQGIRWNPAYRITLKPEMQFTLDYAATLTNNLEDLTDVETVVIAGVPNFQTMAHSAMSTLFEVPQPPRAAYAPVRKRSGANDMMMLSEAAAVVSDSAAPESGTTADLHPEKLGKIRLKKGESLYLPVKTAEGKFDRLVLWELPDRVDHLGNRSRSGSSNGVLQDALRFRNPLDTPMTDAPIEVCDGDSVLSLSLGKWVNVNDETLLPVTRALTVSGTVVEYEINDPKTVNSSKAAPQQYVWHEGIRYRNPDVAGTLTLKNFRETDAKLLIKLRYSGNLLSAEGNPQNEAVERAVYSVNKRNELVWEFTLKPGEERKLNYKYTLLIRN